MSLKPASGAVARIRSVKAVSKVLAGSLLQLICAYGGAAEGTPSAASAQEPRFLEPSQGNVEGIAALGMVPIEEGRGALAPWGALCHLVPHQNPGSEYVYPCGEWVVPPRGAYRFWVEIPTTQQVSPYSSLLYYARVPFSDRGIVAGGPVVRGGLVGLSRDERHRPGLELRLLSARPAAESSYLHHEMSRRIPVERLNGGLLMPAGKTIAALWDPEAHVYRALSKPFETPPGGRVEAPLRWPLKLVDLIIQIQRFEPARTVSDGAVAIQIDQSGSKRVPDLEVLEADLAYAIWYDLEPGNAVLSYRLHRHAETRETLSLSPGAILRRVTGRPSPD